MKKLLFFVLACVLVLACDSSKEVTLSLTNPQDLSVSFSGYYLATATGDSVAMEGVTPREYTLSMEKGDGLTGMVYKDGANMTDTLHFRILVNGNEEVTQKVTTPAQIIQFQITVQ